MTLQRKTQNNSNFEPFNGKLVHIMIVYIQLHPDFKASALVALKAHLEFHFPNQI